MSISVVQDGNETEMMVRVNWLKINEGRESKYLQEGESPITFKTTK
jgi:hypothetical protein